MTITLDISDDILAALLADAKIQGRDAASLAADRLAAWYEPDPLYAPEGSEAERIAIDEAFADIAAGRVHSFDGDAILRKYGLSSADLPADARK